MHIKAVAVTLPNPDYVFTLRSHAYRTDVEWEARDRAAFEELIEAVRKAYAEPDSYAEHEETLHKAVYDPELTVDEAIARIAPYIISAQRRFKSTELLHKDLDEVVLHSPAGRSSEENGYHHIVISRGGKFHPTAQVLNKACRALGFKSPATRKDGSSECLPLEDWQPGMPVGDAKNWQETALDHDSLELRTSSALVAMVRKSSFSIGPSPSVSGRLKVVMVPAECDVAVIELLKEESVAELGRTWR